jgi:hypothetical protein
VRGRRAGRRGLAATPDQAYVTARAINTTAVIALILVGCTYWRQIADDRLRRRR